MDKCAIKFQIESDGAILKDNKSSFATFCYLCREKLFQDLNFKVKLLAELNYMIDVKEKEKYDEASNY